MDDYYFNKYLKYKKRYLEMKGGMWWTKSKSKSVIEEEKRKEKKRKNKKEK